MDKTTVTEIIGFLREALMNQGVHFESIALFGSALTGKMNPDSDIDLIIISRDFTGKDLFERSEITKVPEIQTMKRFKVPMDILNLTPEEYSETKEKRFYHSKIVA